MSEVLPLIDATDQKSDRRAGPERDRLAGEWPPFSQTLEENQLVVARRALRTLQINVGKRCNQACLHCHVEAGPRRREMMTRETAGRVVALMDLDGAEHLETVDITGGAPELNPNFRYLVRQARRRRLRVLDRCNLTVLLEPGQEDTPAFLGDHGVEIVASMPCYARENVEKQRGQGVFDQSIEALRLLNRRGYGQAGSGLILNLVYNPVGAFLPPSQEELGNDYHERLREDFGIEFNQLLTLTNMPIKRFLYDLARRGEVEEYMALLVNSFNRPTVDNVMCRDLLSIGWDGRIFDCDFNQMLEIPAANVARTIWDVDSLESFNGDVVAVADHCYGCTAGAGSSCGGQLN